MNYKKMTYKITWGNNHKKYIKNWKEAVNFAYQKAFYFDIYINNTLFIRSF